MNDRELKNRAPALLILALFLSGMLGCGEGENKPKEEETVDVWQGEEPGGEEETQTPEEQREGGEDNEGSSAVQTAGDDRVRFSQEEEGKLYATIMADLPRGTMVQVVVTGKDYRYETRYKVQGSSNKVGPITREGQPLKSGTFELTWEPLPTHTQIEEIRSELRRKNISGGKKSVTLPI